MSNQVRTKTVLELLLRQYPDQDRNYLRVLIDCRQVLVDGETCTDMKMRYPFDSTISLVISKYVSRGGLKLEHALHHWSLDVEGLVMVDAGSSTGGFTDCLLQRGSALVHAVDVGYNQLAYRLRTDARVQVHERVNIMSVETLDPPADAAVADLSFRSITGAARHILSLTAKKWMISLIKPQFEVPKGSVGFSGVVRDPALLRDVLAGVYRQLVTEGVGVVDLIESPILGRKGNREFLAWLSIHDGLDDVDFMRKIDQVLSDQ